MIAAQRQQWSEHFNFNARILINKQIRQNTQRQLPRGVKEMAKFWRWQQKSMLYKNNVGLMEGERNENENEKEKENPVSHDLPI